MYYRKCEYCGAALDPGEICDCKKEGGPPITKQTGPHIIRDSKKKSPKTIISQNAKKSKSNPLRYFRVSQNIQAKDIVDTVRELYPKYDKVLQSKCERGEEYGIDLKMKAFDALLEKYAPDMLEIERHRRDGRHRLKCKVMCRLEDYEYHELHRRIRADGFSTMQAWLTFVIREYLKGDIK